jgi:hypothetical protein
MLKMIFSVTICLYLWTSLTGGLGSRMPFNWWKCLENLRMHWIHLAQDRGQWQDHVNTIMNLQVPWTPENFLRGWATVGLLRTQLGGVRDWILNWKGCGDKWPWPNLKKSSLSGYSRPVVAAVQSVLSLTSLIIIIIIILLLLLLLNARILSHQAEIWTHDIPNTKERSHSTVTLGKLHAARDADLIPREKRSYSWVINTVVWI